MKKLHNKCVVFLCGRGEIRTHGTLSGSTVFKTVPFNHSGTLPYYLLRKLKNRFPRGSRVSFETRQMLVRIWPTRALFHILIPAERVGFEPTVQLPRLLLSTEPL